MAVDLPETEAAAIGIDEAAPPEAVAEVAVAVGGAAVSVADVEDFAGTTVGTVVGEDEPPCLPPAATGPPALIGLKMLPPCVKELKPSSCA